MVIIVNIPYCRSLSISDVNNYEFLINEYLTKIVIDEQVQLVIKSSSSRESIFNKVPTFFSFFLLVPILYKFK